MSRFSNIAISGFRRIYSANLEMRPLGVMIGANGVGKTSFLDAFALIASSADGRLSEQISLLGGMQPNITIGMASAATFHLQMSVPGKNPLVYEFSLEPNRNSYLITEERLTQDQGKPNPFKHIESTRNKTQYFDPATNKLLPPTWDYDNLETALSQVPKLFQAPEELRNRLASSTFYHALGVGPKDPVRLPQQMQPALLPGKNGERLVTCLYQLRETERDRFEDIEETLRTAFPGFERLEFPAVAAGTLAMAWRDKNFSDSIYSHQLSEGTLRFLWLTTLLKSPGLAAMTLLDEPEVSLHPELLSMMADLLREASNRTQIVVATHSDRLIRFLEPQEVIVMDLEEFGTARMNWADTLDLNKWLEEYTLDEMWRKGRLGGRA